MSAETVFAEMTSLVPGVSCDHCKTAITEEVGCVDGVSAVDVDLDGKRVTVRSARLHDVSLREAIADAGYDAE